MEDLELIDAGSHNPKPPNKPFQPPDECNRQPTAEQMIYLGSQSTAVAVLYCLLAALTIHQTYHNVVAPKKQRVFLMTVFYFLAILCTILRIIQFILQAVEDFKNRDQYYSNVFQLMASFCTGNIALFQCLGMIDLTIRIKSTVQEFLNEENRPSTQRVARSINCAYGVTIVISAVSAYFCFLLIMFVITVYTEMPKRPIGWANEQYDTFVMVNGFYELCFYAMLIIYVTATFCFLNRTLNKYFTE